MRIRAQICLAILATTAAVVTPAKASVTQRYTGSECVSQDNSSNIHINLEAAAYNSSTSTADIVACNVPNAGYMYNGDSVSVGIDVMNASSSVGCTMRLVEGGSILSYQNGTSYNGYLGMSLTDNNFGVYDISASLRCQLLGSSTTQGILDYVWTHS